MTISPLSRSVVIVLGYKNEVDGSLDAIARQRADKAFEIAQGSDVNVLCTGGRADHFNQSDIDHGVWMQRYLQDKGIRKAQFLPVARSRNTYEDGKLCAEILHNSGISQIILVTSDFHIQRGFLWLHHFCPRLLIVCKPSRTLASDDELFALKAHEHRAIRLFYQDFPETLCLNALYDWRSLLSEN